MTKRCPVCHDPFETDWKQKVYCSGWCYRAAERQRRRKAKGKKITCPHCHKDVPLWRVWHGRNANRL